MTHDKFIRRARAPAGLLGLVVGLMASAPLGAEAVRIAPMLDPFPGSAKSTEFMHARYFSPNLGRFLSVDLAGGRVGSSQKWNRYSYSSNNPLTRVDTDGRMDRVFILNQPTMFSEGEGRRLAMSAVLAARQTDVAYSPSLNLPGGLVKNLVENLRNFRFGLRGLDWFAVDIQDLRTADGSTRIGIDFTTTGLGGLGASLDLYSKGSYVDFRNLYLNWFWLKLDPTFDSAKPNLFQPGVAVGPFGQSLTANADQFSTSFFDYFLNYSLDELAAETTSGNPASECQGDSDCWLRMKREEMESSRRNDR